MPNKPTAGTGRTGRRLTLDDEIIDKFVEAFSSKTKYNRPACAFVGVSERAFLYWRNEGRAVLDERLDDDGEVAELLITLEIEAEAARRRAEEARGTDDAAELFKAARAAERRRLCVRLVDEVERAHDLREFKLSEVWLDEALTRRNYVAAKEYLARTEPDRYGAGHRVKVSGEAGGDPVKVGLALELLSASPDKIAAILAATDDLASRDDADLDEGLAE